MRDVPTGVPGLDELLNGGLLEGSVSLVSGGPGTGKTILCTQYVYNGAAQYNEPSIFVTLEEGATNIWWNMQNFKWNVSQLQRQGLMKIYRIGEISAGEARLNLVEEVEKLKGVVKDMDAKRVVFDSLSSLAFFEKNKEDKYATRQKVFYLISELKDMGVTSMLTSEISSRNKLGVYGSDVVADGILLLQFAPPYRYVSVRKMRGIDHDPDSHPFAISENGIVVNPREKGVSELF